MRPAAFFDVDDTLITVVSMFDYLAYEVVAGHRSQDDHDRVMAGLRAMRAAGHARAEVNRAYYRAFRGRGLAEVSAAGRSWFAAALAQGGFFRPEALTRLGGHVAAGHLVVLVSGSFPACLEPIAEHVGAERILCSRPEVRRGCYTGDLAEPMIGARKAAAVAASAAAWGVALDRSYAYGDHESDLPLLNTVGNPVVVGADPGLARHADAHGWASL